jgi:hypothetical protein
MPHRETMNALQACLFFTAKRPQLPALLAPILHVDMKTPIKVQCSDGVGEIVVDLWPHTMAAVLEAEGRLEDCHDADDLTKALTECLLSGWENRLSSEQIGLRSHELAIEVFDLGIKLKQARENN